MEEELGTLLENSEKHKYKGNAALLFDDKNVKNSFLLKVYSILLIQLIITSAIVYFIYSSVLIRQKLSDNPTLFHISIIIMLILLLIMAILEKLRRKSPLNYILLAVFTLGESFLLGLGCIQFKTHDILIALLLCCILCLTLMVFSCQNWIDFTVCGLFLLITMTFLIICGIVLMFFPSKMWTIIYSNAGVILFSFCLIYDTQVMLNGKHKNVLSPDDYCFAALSLYLDIINIFYYILLLFGFYRE